MNMSEIIDERRYAFNEKAFSEGNDGHYWDYAQWIAELLGNGLSYLEEMLGSDQVEVPFRQMLAPIEAASGEPGVETWRDVLDDVLTVGTSLPISERFHFAYLYGYFGILPDTAPLSLSERNVWVRELVANVQKFASKPDVLALGKDNALQRIANLALSRFAIDTGDGEIDIHSMSIFGGISEGRVRNMLSGTSSVLERGKNGGVNAMSANAWLHKKGDFLPSIWQNTAIDDENEGATTNDGSTIISGRVIFVPVARDGSMFTPEVRREQGYQLGAKGEEVLVQDYGDALETLNKMSVPRWRRPNTSGIWGIVSGVSWQRIELGN